MADPPTSRPMYSGLHLPEVRWGVSSTVSETVSGLTASASSNVADQLYCCELPGNHAVTQRNQSDGVDRRDGGRGVHPNNHSQRWHWDV